MFIGWDVKWCPVSRITPPWHAKDRFTGWLLRSPGKLLQNFKTDYIKLIVAAVTWLNYCRYGVKRYPINQSISHLIIKGNIFEWEGKQYPIKLNLFINITC